MQPEGVGVSFIWDNGAHNDAVELFFFQTIIFSQIDEIVLGIIISQT